MADESIVYVVDDDPAMRSSLEWVFKSASLHCVSYPSTHAYLEDFKPDVPSCLILDLRLAGENGLDLVEGWAAKGESNLPVIVVTGTGDVPLAVKSLKLGVVDFLEKPADPAILLERVRAALVTDAKRRMDNAADAEIRNRLKDLTKRERELLKLVCAGHSNKQIAKELNISVKTVANHRAHVLAKAKALNTADMVRLAVLADEA